MHLTRRSTPAAAVPVALLALSALALLGACTSVPPPPAVAPTLVAEAWLERPPALHAEGLPPLQRSRLAAVQRYGDVAGHQFLAWHPTAPEMLLRHRGPGSASQQLYRQRGAAAAPERLTDGADPVAAATWEPQRGEYIVFTRARGGDEAFQLYRLDPATRATTQITRDGQRHALNAWIKSRGLAVVSSVPLDRTAQGGTRSEISTTLSLIDPLQPAAARVLTELPGGGWFGAEVAPDERRLAITRYVSAAQSEVWLIDLASGERSRVLPAPGEALPASHFVEEWSADGRHLYVASDRAGEFRELMRLEPASGTLTRLTADIGWDVEGNSVSEHGLALSINVDGRNELRLLDAASGRRQALPAGVALPGGSLTQPRWHPKLPLLAYTASSAQGPGQVHVLDLQAARSQPWTRPHLPAGLAAAQLAQLPDPEIVRWKSFDGRTISGVLHRPAPRFAGPRPVLVVMHGGPAAQARAGWLGRMNYLTQERGIAVLEPNVRGSTGYGKTFVTLDDGYQREDSVKDMGAALDWIASRREFDARRVVVSGGSYGGYMALAASVQLAERIAGAVSVVGISNFVTFLERTESYRRDLRRVEYGDEREPLMRAFLERIAPLNNADRITKPLFVAQGRNDPRVPWTESEQIVRKLQARGAPVWYLLADNEGHGYTRRENADYYFVAFVAFLEQTLRPD